MCPKPRNHETTKPWNLSDLMSQRWSWQNHETTKPQNLSDLMSQRWSWRNHESKKPWNLSAFDVPEMEWAKPRNHETTKPQNHETYRHLMSQWWSVRNHETMKPQNLLAFDVPEMELAKPRNHATMKPIGIWCPRDGVGETTKPWNHETTKSIVIWFEDIFLPRQHINDIYVIRTVQVLHFFANDWLTVEYLYRFNVLIFFKWEDNTAYNFIFLQIVANLVGIFKQIIFGQVVKVNIEWKRSLRGKNKVKHPAQIGCV